MLQKYSLHIISLPFSGFQLWGRVPWDEEERSHGVHVTQGCKGDHTVKGTRPPIPITADHHHPGRPPLASPSSSSTAPTTAPYHQ